MRVPNWLVPSRLLAGDQHQIALLSHTVLLLTVGVSLFASVVSVLASDGPLWNLIPNMVVILLELAALVVLRRGHVRVAAWLLVGFLWVTLAFLSVLIGGLSAATISLLSVTVLVAGMTIGYHGNMVVSVASILLLTIFLAFERYAGGLPMYLGQTDATIWLTGVVTIAGTGIFTQVAMLVFRETVGVARRNEAYLKQALDELQATSVSHEYIDSIFQSMSDMLLVLDADLNIVTVNQSLLDRTGHTRDGLINTSFRLLATDDEPLFMRLVGLVDGNGSDIQTTTTYYTRLGKARSVYFSASLMHAQVGRGRVVCVAQDITDRIQAERDLAQERTLLRTLLDSLPDYVHVKDIEGRYLLSNKAHLRLTGFEQQSELVGKTSEDLYGPAVSAAYLADDEYIRCTGQPILGVERRGVSPDGDQIWIHTNKVPLRDDEGQIIGIVAIATDITARRQSEERVRESEQRLRMLVQNAPVFIFAIDQNYDLTFFEGQGSTNIDIEHVGQALGQSLFELDTTTSGLRVMESIKRAFDGETIHSNIELGALAFDIRYSPVVDNQGYITSVIGVATDITEQVQMTAALRASEARNRALLGAMPDMMFVIDERGTFTEMNAPDSDDLMLPLDEVVGARLADAFQDEALRDALWGHIKACLQTDQPRTVEYMLDTPTGEKFYEARLVRLSEQEVMVLVRNMTDQHNAAEEIRRREQMYRTLARNLPATAVTLFDEDLRVMVAEGGALLPAGFNLEFIEGSALWELLPPDQVDSFTALARRTLAGKTITKNIHMEAVSGYYSLTAVPIRNDEGIIFAGLVVVRDVTEEYDKAEALRQYATALERSNDELQQFAYVASHDLQEPLRKIRAFGDRLATRTDGTLDPTSADYLMRMQSAAGRMQNLIEDLLAFSRVTTAAKPFKPLHLNEIVAEALTDLELRVEQTRAVVDVGMLPVVEGERLQLRQLFQNLLGNALKYHREGVPLEVRVWAEVRGISAYITVSDNGIGFDNKYAERIFGLFQRLHNRQSYEGTGMGLAICRKIVERHGGSITAEGQDGVGATFTLVLPVQQQSPSILVKERR